MSNSILFMMGRLKELPYVGEIFHGQRWFFLFLNAILKRNSLDEMCEED